MSELFATAATRLAGVAGAWFSWRPDEFWAATPDELAALFRATSPAGEGPPSAAELAQLKERFPDG